MRLKVASTAIVLLLVVLGVLSDRVPQLHFVQEGASWLLLPIQVLLGKSADAASSAVTSVASAAELRSLNEELQQQVAKLQQDTARLGELERENAQLRDYLELRKSLPDLRFVETAVIASDPSSLVRAITVNRGSDVGIKEGMTAMTQGGLVGRVIKVSQSTAKILLITDTSNSVTGVVQSSRAQGVVTGERTRYLRMRYLPQAATLRAGDKVLTSGIGGIYPPGVLIGTLVSVSKNDTDIFQEGVIEPAANLEALEQVLVITNYIPIKLETN